MQNKRDFKRVPALTGPRLKLFASKWRLWWTELQPSWRETEQWPFERTITQAADGDTWDTLLQGGSNGVFLIIVSLSWWVSAVHKGSGKQTNAWKELSEAMADVDWVFEQLAGCGGVASSPGTKRKAGVSTRPEPRKKARK